MIQTEIRSRIPYNKVKSYSMDENTTMETLSKLGFSFSQNALNELKGIVIKNYALDSDVPMVTTPSTPTLIQFLQYWIPNIIKVLTAARKIDDIAGRTMAGTWSDEEIVQTFLERTGTAKIYGDYNNVPTSDWNQVFERRNIVRLELGVETAILEEERAGKMRINSQSEKKTATAEALGIAMNKIGFYGYNNGLNRTYGFLNDPNLPAYITVAPGASGQTTWSSKTFLEIIADIQTIIQRTTTQCLGRFDPYKDSFQLVLPLAVQQSLDVTTTYALKTVKEFLFDTYKGMRIEFATQLNQANGGANVIYLILDKLGDSEVLNQYIQEVFRLLGVQKTAKGMLEDYSCATAGVMFKQPLGVCRYTGI